MFKGSYVALITPFKQGRIDEDALRKLVHFHLQNGSAGLVPCGTTGESATLSMDEHKRVVEIVVEEAGGKIPVIAGTGSNNTAEAVELTRHAKQCKANACLLITPYYNKPTPEGLYLHFKKIAESTRIPLILYNVPSRTGVNLLPETLQRLNKDCPNIIGVKEASGNLDHAAKIIQLCTEKFCLLSGEDSLTLPLLSLGAKGVISVLANIFPQEMSRLVEEFLKGNAEEARKIHHYLFPLMKAIFLETNPGPVKTAMSILGRDSGELRLPLAPMGEENVVKLKEIMRTYFKELL